MAGRPELIYKFTVPHAYVVRCWKISTCVFDLWMGSWAPGPQHRHILKMIAIEMSNIIAILSIKKSLWVMDPRAEISQSHELSFGSAPMAPAVCCWPPTHCFCCPPPPLCVLPRLPLPLPLFLFGALFCICWGMSHGSHPKKLLKLMTRPRKNPKSHIKTNVHVWFLKNPN